VEAGLPVPREAMHLQAGDAGVRLVGNRTGVDHTERLTRWAEARVSELAALDLDGYVLKKDSPSCGLERVRLHPAGGGGPARSATGLFAATLARRLPTLPLTEEGWLNDTALRDSFLTRVFTHRRFRAAGHDRADLVEFHARHKLLFMAHSPARQRLLGQLVAGVGSAPLPEMRERYLAGAMATLAVRASRGKHANVLQHILGYFKQVLSPPDKQEILALVAEFQSGYCALAVPLTLLLHHLRRHDVGDWLPGQVYFAPYPRQIAAR
jgi:uncharacterized protein YbgA (DUF1722 family)/uncharacterized protein YbbK (DUF523 family)